MVRSLSEQVGDFILGRGGGLLLVCKALGKLALIAVMARLKLNKIAHADAPVAPNSVEENLSAVQQLVQVGATHPESFSRLIGSERRVGVDCDDLIAVTHAASQVEKKFAQLRASVGPREFVEGVELVVGNVLGCESMHGGHPYPPSKKTASYCLQMLQVSYMSQMAQAYCRYAYRPRHSVAHHGADADFGGRPPALTCGALYGMVTAPQVGTLRRKGRSTAPLTPRAARPSAARAAVRAPGRRAASRGREWCRGGRAAGRRC